LSVFDCILEPLLHERDFRDEIGDGVGEGFVRGVLRGGLNPQHKLVLQGMGDFVAGKQNLGIFHQLGCNKISKSVVLFIHSKQGCIWYFGVFLYGNFFLTLKQEE